MILKNYIVEQNHSVLDDFQTVLFYGENDGVKDDIKIAIKKLNKDAEIINLFEMEIIKNKNVLYDNLVNESLFNEKKIIIIQSATDRILPQIDEGIKKKNKETKIYIFSDILDTKSKLRNLFTKQKNLAAIPCYQDSDRTLFDYTKKKLNGLKGVTTHIVNLIISNSNSNRKIIKNEISKIRIFFDNKNIDQEKLLEILNIKSDTEFVEIINNALMGNKAKINTLLSEIDLLSEDSFFHLNNFNYRIFKLIEIQKMSGMLNSHEEAIANLKPPIFWKDKTAYVQQLRKWNLEKLNELAYKIGETETLIKKNSQIRSDIIIKNLIINVSLKASSSF